MIREIYTRDETDPHYDPKFIDYVDEVESTISQIRMILGTTPGEVFGSPSFGMDIEDYIFRTKYSAAKLNEILADHLNNYMTKYPDLTVTTDISFGDSGKGWDFAILDIYINGKKTLGFLVDKEDNDSIE